MKTKRRIICVIICLLMLFGIPLGAVAEELSFDQALGRLREKNESVKAAQMEEEQKKHEKAAAQGLYFPKVQFGARYTRIDEPITIDLNDIRTVILGLHPVVPAEMVPSFEKTVQDDKFWRANVTAFWPIFTGGQILAGNRAADAFLNESREKLRYTESTLTTELVRRYFGLRLARKVFEVRKQVLEGMDKHLYQAKKLEENGMIARAERLHAEVAWAEAEREYKRAKRNEKIAQTALSNILSSKDTIDPTSSLFLLRKVEFLAEFRSRVIGNNPILKQLAAKKDAAHQSYKKEMGTLFPQVLLFGQYELYKEDLTMLDPEWAVGVGVNFPLFQGGARLNRLKAAKSLEEKVFYLEQRANRDIETLVEKRYHELMKALEQYEALESALVSTREYLRVRTRSFEEGFATSVDVVDAQLALSRVKIESLVAVYDFDVALAELLEASGESEKFETYRARADLEVSF